MATSWIGKLISWVNGAVTVAGSLLLVQALHQFALASLARMNGVPTDVHLGYNVYKPLAAWHPDSVIATFISPYLIAFIALAALLTQTRLVRLLAVYFGPSIYYLVVFLAIYSGWIPALSTLFQTGYGIAIRQSNLYWLWLTLTWMVLPLWSWFQANFWLSQALKSHLGGDNLGLYARQRDFKFNYLIGGGVVVLLINPLSFIVKSGFSNLNNSTIFTGLVCALVLWIAAWRAQTALSSKEAKLGQHLAAAQRYSVPWGSYVLFISTAWWWFRHL